MLLRPQKSLSGDRRLEPACWIWAFFVLIGCQCQIPLIIQMCISRVCLHDNDCIKPERFFLCIFEIFSIQCCQNKPRSHGSAKTTKNAALCISSMRCYFVKKHWAPERYRVGCQWTTAPCIKNGAPFENRWWRFTANTAALLTRCTCILHEIYRPGLIHIERTCNTHVWRHHFHKFMYQTITALFKKTCTLKNF